MCGLMEVLAKILQQTVLLMSTPETMTQLLFSTIHFAGPRVACSIRKQAIGSRSTPFGADLFTTFFAVFIHWFIVTFAQIKYRPTIFQFTVSFVVIIRSSLAGIFMRKISANEICLYRAGRTDCSPLIMPGLCSYSWYNTGTCSSRADFPI